jgi:hypothetical protein
MRFSAVIISSLAALASAAPNELVSRNNDQIAGAIRFAALADGCSLLKCAEVVANIGCIALALAAEPETGGTDTGAIVACVKEGLGEVRISFHCWAWIAMLICTGLPMWCMCPRPIGLLDRPQCLLEAYTGPNCARCSE